MGKYTYVVILNPALNNEDEYEDFDTYEEAAKCRDSLDANGECVDIMMRLPSGALTCEY